LFARVPPFAWPGLVVPGLIFPGTGGMRRFLPMPLPLRTAGATASAAAAAACLRTVPQSEKNCGQRIHCTDSVDPHARHFQIQHRHPQQWPNDKYVTLSKTLIPTDPDGEADCTGGSHWRRASRGHRRTLW